MEIIAPNEELSIGKEASCLYSIMFGQLLDDNDETPSLITDRLYLGAASDARNLDKIQRYNIKYILNMTGSKSYPADYFINSNQSDIKLLLLDTHDLDDYDMTVHFTIAIEFIQKSIQANNGNVLVHCAAGVSRSALIVAVYLMIEHKISASESILRVHQARPCVCPNLGFLRQLIRFERMQSNLYRS